jgi:hypothetical protein
MRAEPTILGATLVVAQPAQTPRFVVRHRSHGTRLLEFARHKPLGAVGGLIVLLLLFVALAAPWLAPYSYDDAVASMRLQGPSLAHPFGTDANGRDMLSRIIWVREFPSRSDSERSCSALCWRQLSVLFPGMWAACSTSCSSD